MRALGSARGSKYAEVAFWFFRHSLAEPLQFAQYSRMAMKYLCSTSKPRKLN